MNKIASSIIFFIVLIIFVICITNNHIKKKSKELDNQNYVYSNSYHTYIIDTLKQVNDDAIFNIFSSRTYTSYIIIGMQSTTRLTYEEYCKQSQELINNLYEQIKDKTIKKDGILSNSHYTINLEFYERFNDNMNPEKKKALQVGIYQIHTDDLERYRDYNKCVNGGINDLEWKQERH